MQFKTITKIWLLAWGKKNSSSRNIGISFQNFSFALLTIMHYKNICLADFFDVKWKWIPLVTVFCKFSRSISAILLIPSCTNLYWWEWTSCKRTCHLHDDLALAVSKSYGVSLHLQILYLYGLPLCFTVLLSHCLYSLCSGSLLERSRQLPQDEAARASWDGLILTPFLKIQSEDWTEYGQHPPSTWTGLIFSSTYLQLHVAQTLVRWLWHSSYHVRLFCWKRNALQ